MLLQQTIWRKRNQSNGRILVRTILEFLHTTERKQADNGNYVSNMFNTEEAIQAKQAP
jgi:hypothetical protein